MNTKKKVCVLIDMDNTLVEKDTDEVQFTLLPKTEYENFLKENYVTWTQRMNAFYKRIKLYGIALDNIKEILYNMIYTPKIKNFLNYLHSNPDKYDLYILSGATSLSVNCILNSKHIKDGQVTGIYFMMYGLARFFIEPLRQDSLFFGTMKAAQLVSVVMFVCGAVLIIIPLLRREHDQ